MALQQDPAEETLRSGDGDDGEVMSGTAPEPGEPPGEAASPVPTDRAEDTEPTDRADRPEDTEPTSAPALVVGVGASAGGLDALQRFVADLHPGLRTAYVIVQHLSPDHPSLMVEILERHTSLPVVKITDGAHLAPDTVHVLPPRTEVRCAGGLLLLDARSGIVSTPIDRFLSSLAEDQGPRAVAVILSGTGSDGSRGSRAVADAGGLVLVQAPDSAAFDGMPRATIGTGAVDLVLEPQDMAAAIREHADHPQITSTHDVPPLPGEELATLLSLVKQHTGTDFSLYKRATINRRIERRLNAVGVDSIGDYLAHAREETEELTRLRRELLIGVTRFLRDVEAFDALADGHLDELLRRGEPAEPVRAWVAGCSTGEEAYTLAILLDEARQRTGINRDIRVFATDVDREAIEVASRGAYSTEAVQSLGAKRVARYFHPQNGGVVVDQSLRQLVVFAAHDVTRDPPFARLALVTCRNLLIYLEPALQQRVIGLLHFALGSQGLLLLGPSETLGELAGGFETLDRRWKLYRRTGSRSNGLPGELRPPRIQDLPRGIGGPGGNSGLGIPGGGGNRSDAPLIPDDRTIDACYRELVDTHVPPCLLVSEHLQLVHVFGDAHRFLRVPKGAATLDLQRMLPGTSAAMLRAAVHRCLRTGDEMRYTGVFDDTPGGPADVRVRAFSDDHQLARYALVFIETPRHRSSDDTPTEAAGSLDQDVREHVQRLEHELQDARETLQATVEELETSNEELQATNEELLASNEELQATNEELHSVNEELHSVNAEYQDKIDELVEANADLDHLFINTHVGVVFVDAELRVRKFTAGLNGLINLISRDLGRPLSDITHRLDLTDLDARLAEVVHSGVEMETTTRSQDGRELLLRAWPYDDPGGERHGGVLTLTDVTELRRAERSAQVSLDALPEHICVLDPQGVIIAVNRAWEIFARDNGAAIDDPVGVGADYLATLRTAALGSPELTGVADQLEAVLAGELAGFSYAYPCDTVDGQVRNFVMHVRPRHDPHADLLSLAEAERAGHVDAGQAGAEHANHANRDDAARGNAPHTAGPMGAVVSHVDITNVDAYTTAADRRR